MSKIEAYKCDCCGAIYEEENVKGILFNSDMFDLQNSYPFSNKPKDASVHTCVSCVREKVFTPAERKHNRAKDESGYMLSVKELMYMHRRKLATDFDSKKKK